MTTRNDNASALNVSSFQFNSPSPWSPKIVSTQLATIGPLVIACVPGEFTTMSGRRVRRAISDVLCGGESPQCIVVIAGLCNTYSDYITTPEEYKVNDGLTPAHIRSGFFAKFVKTQPWGSVVNRYNALLPTTGRVKAIAGLGGSVSHYIARQPRAWCHTALRVARHMTNVTCIAIYVVPLIPDRRIHIVR